MLEFLISIIVCVPLLYFLNKPPSFWCKILGHRAGRNFCLRCGLGGIHFFTKEQMEQSKQILESEIKRLREVDSGRKKTEKGK